MTDPTPETWTLRLKSHRTTTLLHISPLQSFPSIKTALYTALSETDGITSSTSSTTHPLPLPLPASPEEIQLGRPIDPLDASAGFVLGEWETPAPSLEDVDVAIEEDLVGSAQLKGKGKASSATSTSTPTVPKSAKTKSRTATADAKNCPKGAGLRDGAVLAFSWDGDGVAESEREEGGMWGVKLASFEDAYGVQNEGDLGARGEFEG